MKPMLRNNEIIQHIKNKGIKFDYISENDVSEFLLNHNYFLKVASYRENYKKDKEGKYINLDFQYLVELSKLDAELRHIIFRMTLDIEHFLKVKLLRAIDSNKQEDGYNIIQKFLSEDNNFKYLKTIRSHKASGYCKDLIDKYYPYFPIWVFVELITFGTLAYLCDFYYKRYDVRLTDNKLLNSVRDLRNASAHNNCLLNNLAKWNNDSYQGVSNRLGKIAGLSNDAKKKQLKNKFMCDVVSLLYAYDDIVPACVSKEQRYKELRRLLFKRMREHSRWFIHNDNLRNAYRFMRKVVLTIT